MIRQRLFALLAAIPLLIAALTVWGPAHAQERSYILATATTGGTYYPVGVALSTLIKVKLEPTEGIAMSAISSAGSAENIKLMREDQAQFSILQGLYGAWAWEGEGQLEKEGSQKFLRSVTMLWPNVEHFVVDSGYVKTGAIEDIKNLKGEKFSIGQRNSGTEGSNRQILNNLGIDPDETFDLVYLGYAASAEALQNGTIEGMNTPAGVPVSAVAQAFAALGDKIAILGFTDEQIKQANGKYRLWTPYVIKADTYPGQKQEVRTIAQPNFLAVNADIDEEDVYLITKAIYENLPFLNNIHGATKEMDVNKALEGLPLPLHPGAVRYYQEVGVTIPDELLPE